MKTGALIFVMTLSLMSLANDGKYLEVMNGKIEFTSAVNVGTTFNITIPHDTKHEEP